MASVFKAVDWTTGLPCALKIPFFPLESDPVFYGRFQREIEIGRSLDHPNIVKVLAVERPSRPYMATEFLEGETLWDRLQRGKPLPFDEARCLAIRLCDAIEYLQRHKVVHRDLKPTNVMLCRDGSLRIMDFGIAIAGAARRLTLAGFGAGPGTVEYMSPEQARGPRGDHRIDIYSVGAMLYEMTTGHTPFDDQPDLYSSMTARMFGDPIAPRVHNPGISPELEEIILHALARDPSDRYQSAGAMRADLEAPERVTMTQRAKRLQAPKLPDPHLKVAVLIAAALIAPVVLFFLFWLALR